MREFAYVDEDGQVRVRDLDLGSELCPSLMQGSDQPSGCAWPTWSPDGSGLAFVRFEFDRSRVDSTTIQVTRNDGSDRVEVYRSDGVPIYFSWAPNGQRIALLVQEEESLGLRVIDIAAPGRSISVARGTPLYFTWQPDSRGLVAHVGGEVLGSVRPRLVWIRLEGGQVESHVLGDSPAAGFRAPSWGPDALGATVAIARNGVQSVGLAQSWEGAVRSLFECGIAPAFVWSPNGTSLAYSSRSAADGPYDGVWIYRTSSQTTEQVSEAHPLAFLWCGNDRVMFTTGPIGDRAVGIRVVHIDSRVEDDYGFFRPSRDLVMLFGHFDQYASSSRLLSPSGDEVLLAASLAKEQENGSVPTVRQILVRRLELDATNEVVGRGRVAFWRPTNLGIASPDP